MTSSQPYDMANSRVFGEVAETYDAARPGYPDALIAEVLAYASLGDLPAVEIGAGTGKATVPFAALGTPMVCVEPDARMAEVLRRNTAAFPHVRVEVSAFEQWRPHETRFGLLLAATSWHWTDPATRWDRVHDALAPGGAVALFWNPQGLLDPGLQAALREVDHRYGLTLTPHTGLASSFGDVPGHWPGMLGHWPDEECRQDGRFTDLRSLRIRERTRFDTDRYLGHLTSISVYRALPADRRDRALADTAAVLDAHGGGIDVEHHHDLFLARTLPHQG
ncbi:class I SAM-dependent methyltransferase [Kitasatospora sp. NPDC002965]|uniref:class I SAM-dependent methyltransferase n=1 Tax=Kitasatospora sp. NPDC002965 TaxID=3154775 RepID=UPI0033BAF780